MFLRIISYASIFIVVVVAIAFVWVKLTEVEARELSDLKNGDIVVQTTDSDLTWAIMLASNSIYTHMGILKIKQDGSKVVIEASNTVLETPLDKWIKRGVLKRVTILRLKNLPPETARDALVAADSFHGFPYDFFFHLSDDQIYCSELVYKAFLKAGLEVGKKERVRDLSIANFAVQSHIEKWWKKHPDCRARGFENYKDCLPLILDQKLVTPVSVTRDPKLKLIYTNYGPDWWITAW